MRAVSYFCALCLFMMLGACQGFNATTDTLRVVFLSDSRDGVDAYAPGFEYIEVEWQGRKTAMALGSRGENIAEVREHWYSGAGEMLVLKNGRIVEVLGMTQEIRQTSQGEPSIAHLQADGRPLTWMRTRNVHPGYRYGVNEYVTSRVKRLVHANGKSEQVWVVEDVKGQRASGAEWHYQERFLLEAGRIVSSEQCVAPDLCIKLKPLGIVVKK